MSRSAGSLSPHSNPPCRHCPPSSSQFTRPSPSLVRAPRFSLEGSPGFLSVLPASAPIRDQKRPPTPSPQIPSISSCKEQSQLPRSSRPSAQAAGALPPPSGLCLSLPLFFAVSASLSLTRHLCSSKLLPCAQAFPLPAKRGPLLPQAFCPICLANSASSPHPTLDPALSSWALGPFSGRCSLPRPWGQPRHVPPRLQQA